MEKIQTSNCSIEIELSVKWINGKILFPQNELEIEKRVKILTNFPINQLCHQTKIVNKEFSIWYQQHITECNVLEQIKLNSI